MSKLFQFIKLLYSRIRSKTPMFWKSVQRFALSLGMSAVAVLVANGQFSLDLNPTLLLVIKYTVAVCSAIAGTAQLTKEDQPNA